MSLFILDNIEFNINEKNINKEDVLYFYNNRIKPSNKTNKVPITEIVIDEKDFIEIYIETKDDVFLHPNTKKFCNKLEEFGLKTSISDEDFGCFDVINVYNTY